MNAYGGRVGVVESGLLNTIMCRKIRKSGHWRQKLESLLCRTFNGRICGKNRVGRKKIAVDIISVWCVGLDSARTVERLRP